MFTDVMRGRNHISVPSTIILMMVCFFIARTGCAEDMLPAWHAVVASTNQSLGIFDSCDAAYAAASAYSTGSCRAVNETTSECIPSPNACSAIQMASVQWHSSYIHISPGADTHIRAVCPAGGANGSDGGGVYVCKTRWYEPTLRGLGPSQVCCGNPINPALGNKYQEEVDYIGQGPYPLIFRRSYNSGGAFGGVGANYVALYAMGGVLGRGWTATYLQRLVRVIQTSPTLAAHRPDGKVYTFIKVDGVWVPSADGPTDINDRVEELADGWKYTTVGDEVERYDASGRLVSITNRNGLSHTLRYYQGGPDAGLLESATDPFGRALLFSYGVHDGLKRLVSVTGPAGEVYWYGYGKVGKELALLLSITMPDDTPGSAADNPVRRYHYNEQLMPESDHLLSGITDERGTRYSSYTYEATKRAVGTSLAGGVNAVAIRYSNLNYNGTATVTDALGAQRTFGFYTTNHLNRNYEITGDACPECGPASRSYLESGYLSSQIDWNGNRTNYFHDVVRGLETRRVEGLTAGGAVTAQTRTVSTVWHPRYRLPTRIEEPLRITTMAYGDADNSNAGDRGSLLSKTIQSTTDASGTQGAGAVLAGDPRTWTYTYNGNGSVLSVDGPRTDVSDVTTYAYYANDAACPGASAIGCRGQLSGITNAAGHVIQIAEYNAHGQPLISVDPNGLITRLTYDARMRLTSRTVGDELTTYAYDGVGQLTRVTLPDGSYLAYTYDPARRLTQIGDSAGNRIVYTLDLMGNRIKEEVFDQSNQLTRMRARIYSSLNRLAQEIGAGGQATSYGYDNQGNLISVDGPLAGNADVTTNTYDALNRLVRVTDPNSGQINYAYDGLDQLVSVSDPRGLVTTYSYDGLNNLNGQQSPDTGTTVNAYDAAGNLVGQTDAKGQITSYAYDALNRVTTVTYQGGAAHTYAYDQGANGKGRLTQVTEPNSITRYAYDQKGRLLSETRTIGEASYTTAYRYDASGRLTGMTYPGGREVTYQLDVVGRIRDVTTTKDNLTRSLITGTLYWPFGPAQSFTFGNGEIYTRGYDTDGRAASYTLGGQTVAVGYDPASRIVSLADAGNPASANSYSYDAVDRLTGYIGPAANQSYSYDGVGNRLTRTVGTTSELYSYGATSNRLNAITGAVNRTFAYDANGSATADGINQYGYDARGRMVQTLSAKGATAYQVNSFGQRIRKTNAQDDVLYHYDVEGRLIAETSAAGEVRKEYIYLGGIPVAVLQ